MGIGVYIAIMVLQITWGLAAIQPISRYKEWRAKKMDDKWLNEPIIWKKDGKLVCKDGANLFNMKRADLIDAIICLHKEKQQLWKDINDIQLITAEEHKCQAKEDAMIHAGEAAAYKTALSMVLNMMLSHRVDEE